MEVDLHVKENLLLPPPGLLINVDDHIISENWSIASQSQLRTEELISTGFGSSVSSSSGWCSPFGSEPGSTETESDEEDDDFIAELTRQMADYMLEEDDGDDSGNAATNFSSQNLKNSSRSPGSPQFKFSGSGSDSGSTHHGERSPITLSRSTSFPAIAFQAFSDNQTRPVHFYKLENQPAAAKHRVPVRWGGRRANRTELTHQPEQNLQFEHHARGSFRRDDSVGTNGLGSPSAAVQQSQRRRKQHVGSGPGSGSGMRAVFLGGPGSRSGSCGTGVFLPRGTDKPAEVHKKSGCSTILIPARVIHALQYHFEDMNTRSQSNTRVASKNRPPPPPEEDIAAAEIQSRSEPAGNHREMDLPQEWTY
ncbi:hypothetical protein U1Q18_033413 [Sarracenia purpurea var. burkii]